MSELVLSGMPGHLIRRLSQHSSQIFNARMTALGYDLTSVQFAALQVISEKPGIDQAGLAAQIAYDRATIGGVVLRLVKKEFVKREVDSSDRRARNLWLTPVGSDIVSRVCPIVQELQSDILFPLTQDERNRFIEMVNKVIAT